MPMMIRFHRPRVRFRRTDPAGEELATDVELSFMMELQSQTAMNYLAVHLPRTANGYWLKAKSAKPDKNNVISVEMGQLP
jgi:hypothetical protein